MATKRSSSPKSESTPTSSAASTGPEPTITLLEQNPAFDLEKFRGTKDAKALTDWIQEQYTKARQARTQRQLQWYVNMAMFYGKQYVEVTGKQYPAGMQAKLQTPKKPYYRDRKTINRIRAFVRSEISGFQAKLPSAVAVPSTAEDQDVRAAYAAEQVWSSLSEAQRIRYHYGRAIWWMVVTGTGFIKTYWDQDAIDKASGQPGVNKFGAVTPFHLFVPDLREHDIEDQPFVINAIVKSVEWCQNYFGDMVKGISITPSTASANQILDEGYLNLSAGANQPDSVVVYEVWIKPGGHKLFPNGGLVVSIDDQIVSMHMDGMPYQHGEYPFSKIEHIPTSTFYGDSPLVDLNPLQREYNKLRTQISEAGHIMGRPQIIAAEGSITTSKLTNEPGLVINYKMGYPPPQPMALSPLPQYLIDQQDRILVDIEDIGGQHDVSRGQAPPGVTAGTAISFLQEADQGYRTTQHQSLEDGMAKVARQTVANFNQFVDLPRKIQVIGADGAFDTLMLSGSDIAGGTDIRIQPGSSMQGSKAANDARVMDLFGMGIIDQNMALKLLEVGGAQKILDILQVAERKAQRENTKMKSLTPDAIFQHAQQYQQEWMMLQGAQPMQEDPAALDTPAPPVDPMAQADPMAPAMPQMPPPPPVVPVDSFDVHEKHIETHNAFRMSQEYELLPPEVKAQFDQHVQLHEQALFMKYMSQPMPGEGLGGGPGDEVQPSGEPEEAPVEPGLGATMADNGAVPETAPTTGGL